MILHYCSTLYSNIGNIDQTEFFYTEGPDKVAEQR